MSRSKPTTQILLLTTSLLTLALTLATVILSARALHTYNHPLIVSSIGTTLSPTTSMQTLQLLISLPSNLIITGPQIATLTGTALLFTITCLITTHSISSLLKHYNLASTTTSPSPRPVIPILLFALILPTLTALVLILAYVYTMQYTSLTNTTLSSLSPADKAALVSGDSNENKWHFTLESWTCSAWSIPGGFSTDNGDEVGRAAAGSVCGDASAARWLLIPVLLCCVGLVVGMGVSAFKRSGNGLEREEWEERVRKEQGLGDDGSYYS